ncbi:Flp pilus assembly protein CpaB [Parasphingopyxis lamellibrachiae]|uniref:Pilus assembly protein CpaB n=1 Tax=Parasphingopyxis lamellibrachiae TaxID=680125 RepID=A0A3D9FDZ9_9SPHN|nr:Flp pilus assembly protein CpaB [Parasphingopyxis lamellibrachiae]RED15266.1 pilus assembly protein CpaB [Parasphingopyxis lamellibrachiae]
MDARKVILLVGALLIAVVTAFMARSMFVGSSTPTAVAAEAPQGPMVLVATRALPVGTIINQDSFRYQPWPAELIEGTYFIRDESDIDDLLGTVVRNDITAGQPITQGSLVRPGDRGFLAAALGPGMRAVTVPVSVQSGVAGFVFPGDRVDLVLTQEVEGGGDGPPLHASETIIRNLRILAADQRTTTETDENGDSRVQVSNTVTVETTPRIAEKIAVAQTIGQLSLSLRSIADNTAELERAIAAGEVDMPDSDDPEAERRMLIEVAQRPIDTDTTYVTGGDVSRFQRRTVPAQGTDNSGPGDTAAQMAAAMISAATGNPMPVAPAGRPAGPSVRVARGNSVTHVEVGGN